MFILEGLAEVAVQFLGELIWEVLLHGTKEGVKATTRRTTLTGAVRGLRYLLLGALNGWASILFLPRRLLGASPITGASLVIGPLLTGALMWALGRRLPERAADPDSLLNFWPAFDFAFGMAFIRLAHTLAWWGL